MILMFSEKGGYMNAYNQREVDRLKSKGWAEAEPFEMKASDIIAPPISVGLDEPLDKIIKASKKALKKHKKAKK